MAILNNSNAISTAGGYDISNSLRIRGIDASAYLNRTPASAGNRRTWTYSAWIKRGNITPAAGGQSIFYAGNTTSSPRGGIVFGNSGSDNKLSFNGALYNSTTQVLGLETSAEFRDPSAWYHIVVVLDTTQATSSNRAKIYVNGSQVTAFGTATYPSLNQELQYNDAILHATRHPSGDYEYDGYLAEVNFIDGQALTPSSFGETDTTTGSWVAKKYTGTYGTNGFYLKFSDIATTSGSNAGLGKDFSGNANYWTTNNISVTAGTTYDAMTDVPTLTSATVANYATLNPLSTTSTLANANLTYSSGATYCQGTQFPTSGLFYAEIVATGTFSSHGIAWGVIGATANMATTAQPGAATPTGAYLVYSGGGLLSVWSNTGSTNQTNPFTVGQTWQIALDVTTGYMYLGQNNTWYSPTMAATGNPSTGANPTFTLSNLSTSGGFSVLCGNNTAGGTFAWNFGQRPFTYTPPTGFKALNTYNLPDSTIKKGNTVMDATLYTGTGASLSVTNTSAFKPDFVWVKGRSGATDHALYDSVRGTTKDLVSNSTAAETTQAQGLTAFGTNGFTVGTLAKMNTSAATYIGWQWQAGQGSTSSNTNGSITSTTSVNATAGFSVVTFTKTGTATTKTIGHGLGVAPSMIIAKARTAVDNWPVYHISNGATFYQELNTTIAKASGNPWGNTTPTSSVFSIQDNGTANWVAYCWAEIAGFSKFTSYIGNNSDDGPFVYLGFRPKFVMVKDANTAGFWVIFDSTRATYNVIAPYLQPQSSAADVTIYPNIDFLSNGIKLRANNANSAQNNINGNTYIVAAFAENPFKNSLAR
jgi:hypothetical protein